MGLSDLRSPVDSIGVHGSDPREPFDSPFTAQSGIEGERSSTSRKGKKGWWLARLGRLELPAYRFEVCRSIHLSYRRVL